VGRILEEPLRLSGNTDPAAAKELVARTLRDVELDDDLVTRKVSQLSGGQRQRVSIALNIILNHELIILDEPVSALDVTIREQVLELLMRLKKERNLTFIIISHDRRLVSRICNKVYNINNGRIEV
jgi:ABC-type glutathione transport system ATPase component